jgi:hypothetical protein
LTNLKKREHAFSAEDLPKKEPISARLTEPVEREICVPAIDLARLNSDIDELARHVHQPEKFCRFLNAVLDRFANYVYRPGEAVRTRLQIQRYHVDPMIISKIEQKIKSACLHDPDVALALADVLWHDNHYESRLLAAKILGMLPLESDGQISAQVEKWAGPEQESAVLMDLFDYGCTGLRNTNPGILFEMAEKWLGNEDAEIQMLGLRLLLSIVHHSASLQLPRVYSLLHSPLQHAVPRFHTVFLDLLSGLIERSAVETGLFIRHVLLLDPSRECLRIIRRKLSSFPPRLQYNLRQSLALVAEDGQLY